VKLGTGILFACIAAVAQAAAPVVTIGGPALVQPGQLAPLTISLTGSTGAGLAAIEWTVNLPTGASITSTAVSSAWATAGFQVACGTGGAPVCVAYSPTGAVVPADGVLATLNVTMPATPGAFSASVSGLLGADLTGDSPGITLTAGAALAGTVLSKCDINSDGQVNVTDIQVELAGIIGTASCATGNSCTILNLEKVIEAVLGKGCQL
jgi:hypothetical protein